jgi:hypothetical protein
MFLDKTLATLPAFIRCQNLKTGSTLTLNHCESLISVIIFCIFLVWRSVARLVLLQT